MLSKPLFDIQALTKRYHDGTSMLTVLKSTSLTISVGERVAIVGPSGSGKSTLLHLLGGLDTPTEGCVMLDGVSWSSLSEKKKCERRNEWVGFIYQSHHLLPELTALENVAMPLLIRKMAVKNALEHAKKALVDVSLSHRLQHKPSQLSGGERQRVAIARALVHKPKCVLADEPTGNLDHATARAVFENMLALNQTHGTTLLIVTHDLKLAERMDRILFIQDGRLSAST